MSLVDKWLWYRTFSGGRRQPQERVWLPLPRILTLCLHRRAAVSRSVHEWVTVANVAHVSTLINNFYEVQCRAYTVLAHGHQLR